MRRVDDHLCAFNLPGLRALIILAVRRRRCVIIVGIGDVRRPTTTHTSDLGTGVDLCHDLEHGIDSPLSGLAVLLPVVGDLLEWITALATWSC